VKLRLVKFPNGKHAVQRVSAWPWHKPRYLDLTPGYACWWEQGHYQFPACLGDYDQAMQRYTMLTTEPEILHSQAVRKYWARSTE